MKMEVRPPRREAEEGEEECPVIEDHKWLAILQVFLLSDPPMHLSN